MVVNTSRDGIFMQILIGKEKDFYFKASQDARCAIFHADVVPEKEFFTLSSSSAIEAFIPLRLHHTVIVTQRSLRTKMALSTFKVLLASHISCFIAGIVAGKNINAEEVAAYRQFLKQADEEESARFRRRMMYSAAIISTTFFAGALFIKVNMRKHLT